MDFLRQVDWQILRELFFHNRLVLRKGLMIEIQGGRQRCVPVEIPANGHEHAGHACGYGSGGIENVQPSVVREKTVSLAVKGSQTSNSRRHRKPGGLRCLKPGE